MQQEATVKSLAGEEAVISVRRKTACSADCDSCKGCAHPEETIDVTAFNQAKALPGDVVTVESESRTVLGLAALLYLMPLVLMFAGYFITDKAFALSGEGAAIAVAFAGLVAGLAICVAVSRRMKRRGRMTFVITAVTRPGENG